MRLDEKDDKSKSNSSFLEKELSKTLRNLCSKTFKKGYTKSTGQLKRNFKFLSYEYEKELRMNFGERISYFRRRNFHVVRSHLY